MKEGELLPRSGDESALACPVGVLEGSGIHGPPGQVGVDGVVWPGPGVSTGHLCPGIWPFCQGRGWTGTGKANEGETGPWGSKWALTLG